MTKMEQSFGALDGLVVVDLTTMLSGPFATMLLADQGARVIKVEPPGGDNTRRVGPHPEGGLKMEDAGYGGYFASINRNKKSIVIDLKNEEGKETLRRLVDQADVLVENYRAGVMERLGLSYESLAERNPRLVYAAIRGFGDARSGESPFVDWPAYDVVSQALGGMMAITGPVPGGEPTKIGPGVGDTIPSMQCAIGILSAAWCAQRTGKGQFLDVSMVDGIMAICERAIFQHSYTGEIPGPEGNGHPLLCPFGVFPAKDGYVALAAPRDDFFMLFAELIGQPELGADPRYAEMPERVKRQDEIHAIVIAWTSVRTKAEIAEVLGGKVPFGAVQTAKDIFENPHTAARDMLVDVGHPGTGKTFKIAGTPIKLTGTPGGIHRRAPMTGEHTAEILQDFGFSNEESDHLKKSGALG